MKWVEKSSDHSLLFDLSLLCERACGTDCSLLCGKERVGEALLCGKERVGEALLCVQGRCTSVSTCVSV